MTFKKIVDCGTTTALFGPRKITVETIIYFTCEYLGISARTHKQVWIAQGSWHLIGLY